MGSGIPMDEIKYTSIKRSMTITFIITICFICLLSGVTIFLANHEQQEILRNRYAIIRNSNLKMDESTEGYIIDVNENDIEWYGLSTRQNIAYYGCYFIMIGFPVLYIVLGIGVAATIYYKAKLRVPILQLQNGMKRIRNNDLDFNIEYSSNDELGQLCYAMEKMRKELRHNNKILWETLEQRKLLNTSVAHDLRTPITVLKGYLDYLQKNIPQDKVTEEMLLETVSSMQGAVSRLEHYVECVRDIEKIENIKINREYLDTNLLVAEIESNVYQLGKDKKIVFKVDEVYPSVNLDKIALIRVLENLLQNALRYAKNQITIHVYSLGNYLMISVQDDGIGFSEKDLKQATDIFYGNEKGNEHFGIGLSVCKLLCEKHGGFLQVENNNVSGACVTAAFHIF